MAEVNGNKSAASGVFVGRTEEGGFVPHAARDGLPGSAKTVRAVIKKNAQKAERARRRLQEAG
jgi:hypothetical protein